MAHDFIVVQHPSPVQEVRLAAARWTSRLIGNLDLVTKLGGTINVRGGAFEVIVNDKEGKLQSFILAPMVLDMGDIDRMEVFEVCLAYAERAAANAE